MEDMEERLTRISRYADNLIVLSRGLADVYPDAEGAVLSVGEAIKKEAEEAIDAYYEEKKAENGKA